MKRATRTYRQSGRQGRRLPALAAVILLWWAHAPLCAQMQWEPLPDSVRVHADTVLYPHGYHAGYLPPNSPATYEETDTVMIGAREWHYFVFADSIYNVGYYRDAAGCLETELTESHFLWEAPAAAGSLKYLRPNDSTETSPHAMIDWTGLSDGVDTIFIREHPRMYDDILLGNNVICPGDTVIVPVMVIDRPNAMFKSLPGAGRAVTECPPGLSAASPHVVHLPLIVVDSIPAGDLIARHDSINQAQGGLYITYQVEKENGGAYALLPGYPATDTLHTFNVREDVLPVRFTEYGLYRITILSVSNSIAEKCGVGGLVQKAGGENRFACTLIPQPAVKDAHHIRNRRR
ncbi:MAG: hypothetical protein LBR08_05570 [Bacteroidales bacterium]|jgi:hypothetical protein|nr:hypothetical protein [Bacteroidales bacterium]